jgi:hypothetical protein
MKTNFIKLFALLAFIGFTSCSSDDSNSEPDPTDELTNYLPLTIGNYWTYDVVTEGVGNRDSLYSSNDTIISGVSHKKFKTLEAIPNGFYSASLKNNGLRVDGKTVKMSGTANFDYGLGLPINISISNFIILKESAVSNEQLSSVTGTFSQTIEGYPLDFTYTLKTVSDGQVASYTSPNADVYSNVIKTKVILNLKITSTQTIGGFPITVTILAPQDVVTSTQYYAEGIGMVHTNTNISYNLQEIPGVTLPFPSSGSQTQQEFLDTYIAE